MFEDTFEKEMGKYDKFKSALEEGETTQREILAQLKERRKALIASRQNDPTVKQREHAIQSLELAYHKCREIEANLAEGTRFHQDFAVLLKSFKDECQQWVDQRSSELELLARSMAAVSLSKSDEETGEDNALPTPVSPRRDLPPTKAPGVGLPPPGSDDWKEVALPPPPPGASRSRTRSATRGGR